MKHPLPLALAALTLLAFSACRSPRETPTLPSGAPRTAAAPRQYTVIAFSGSVEGISVTGQIRMAKDSLIWCNATKFIEVGRAMASPDSVWVRSSLLGINEAGTYSDVERRTGVAVTFQQLQELLERDDAEQHLMGLARRMGHPATVTITRRQQVDALTFPFAK